MLTVIVSLVLLKLQKLGHELGHLAMARRARVVVEEFAIGYGPRLLTLGRRKGTAYTLKALLLGGSITMCGNKDPGVARGFAGQSKWTRFKIVDVGPVLNVITLGMFLTLAVAFFALAYLSGAPEPVMGINARGEEAPISQTVISKVLDEMPAAEAGLQAGDVFLGADSVDLQYAGDLGVYIEKVVGTEVTLHIDRGGEQRVVSIMPRAHPPENQGPLGLVTRYEGFEYRTTRYALLPALGRGVETAVQLVWTIVRLPAGVSSGHIPAEEARPVEPSTLAQWIGSAAREGIAENQWFRILTLFGSMSIASMFPVVFRCHLAAASAWMGHLAYALADLRAMTYQGRLTAPAGSEAWVLFASAPILASGLPIAAHFWNISSVC